MTVTRIQLDRISSATRNAGLAREVTIDSQLVCKEGYVLAVKILTEKFAYDTIEDVNGRMVKLCPGDILAGVLGARRALRGYAGNVPKTLAVGEKINVLNLGGVLGKCTAGNPEIGPPFEAEVLGAVLQFPKLGDRVGTPAHIFEGTVRPINKLGTVPPVVFIAGTCMNSGKTVAATEIIRTLTKKGIKAAACKMTGVSLMRDTLGMADAGAIEVVDFNDAGVATTWDVDPVPAAFGMLTHLAKGEPDLIVAELGDGILGEYGVDALLADSRLMETACCHIICGPDPVAIFGAHKIYQDRFNLDIHLISGPVTDNSVGRDYVTKNLGLPAHNARFAINKVVEVVQEEFESFKKAKQNG